MTTSTDLSAVFANVVVLLLVAATVVRPRVSPATRLVTVTFAFVCAWLVNAAFDATRPPGWMMVIGSAVILVSLGAVIGTLHLWTRAADIGVSAPERRDDEGGGESRRHWPEAPTRGGDGGDPSWWPDFERQFALHVASERGAKRERAEALDPDTEAGGHAS